MRTFIASILIVLISGCATQADRTAQVQREVDEMIATYGPACDKLGYKSATDPWRDCVLRLNARDNLARYSTTPTTTTCFGHRGFFHCTSL
ncbi:MAG: hypothetical protein E6H65_09040 [Betaproteobacteria bacterium]|jgi:hypothetical protein|nr:MAG: hypothetical protein E6H65_09040 [Betaproteobacteria bacterium]